MAVLKVCALIALSVLVGCSSTTVHLHAKNLPDVEQEAIRAGLEARGFSVKMRDNEPPSNNNAILYYPHDGIDADLQAIDAVLDANGLWAEHNYSVYTDKLGKHEYTAGNIGLYLVPEGVTTNASTSNRVRAVFPITVTDFEFVSTDCDTEYVYELFEDGSLVASDFSLPIGKAKLAALEWRETSDEITLSNSGEQFKYSKTESYKEYANLDSDHVITYNITLQPLGYYRVPYGCTFKSTFSEAY
ncbi:hypothetical protein [Gilvimarinus japonicus]|uniref:Lipoprotein n=1 Tax=Gilvimarinus japonicus TaxID=1796469 RepID=A0ABV7HQP5_9GAMM